MGSLRSLAGIAALAAGLPWAALAQNAAWTRAFNAPGNATAYVSDGQLAGRSIAADASANVVIAGSAVVNAQHDWLVTKLAAADGAIAWQKGFAGAAGGADDAMSVALDASGNAIVAGIATNASNADIKVVKYAAADGAVLWDRTIDSGRDDAAYFVAVDAAGNAYVAGETLNTAGNRDIRVLSLAGATGATRWDRTFDGGAEDNVSDLALDASGNAVVLGVTVNASGNEDIFVAKYAGANGAVLWQRQVDNGGNEGAYGVAADASGNVFVTGFAIGTGGSDYLTLKLAAGNGATLWAKTYDAGGDDFGQAVAVDKAGNAIVTGRSTSAGHFVFRTVKYSGADGSILWQQAFDGGVNDYAYVVAADTAGNAIVFGSTTVGSQTDWKAFAYSAGGGAALYQYGFTGTANVNDDAFAAVATPDGGVVLAGSRTDSGGPTGVRAVKLAAPAAPVTTSLVPHMYQAILQRAPDPAGQAYWDGEVARMKGLGANVNEVWYAMASQFFASAEYAALGRNDAGFAADLYNAFFNRAPDASGLAYWTGQIAGGMPREVALASFMFSAEFANFTQALFGNAAARAEVDMVMDFYRGFLARLPDTAGFGYWVQQFRTAQCQGGPAVYAQVAAISNAFAHSTEYAGRGRANPQYVGDLYNAFLRRGGDLAGVQYWVGQVGTAQSRDAVLQSFVSSPEFGARVAAVVNQGCMP
jgi:hypothetical protein